jgi:hypothetical protein
MSRRNTEFAVKRGDGWKYQKDYNIQISRAAKQERFPNQSEGDFLLVAKDQGDIELSVFGRLQVKKDVPDDGICIGTTLRTALGVTFGDDVSLNPIQPPSKRLHQRAFDTLVKTRPQICRVQKSTYPDPGFNICRISESMKGVLGIKWGDRIVIESPEDRISLRALQITDEFADRKARRVKQEDYHFDCAEVIHGDSEQVDIPSIYIDSERRSQLGLGKKEHWGACQPVRVYRDSTVYFSRQVSEITVPVIAGLFGFIVVFDDLLSFVNLVSLIVAGFLLILFSVVYRARKISLD